MIKDILMGNEARLKVKAGIDKACDAVRPTLGAIGMTAYIEYPGLDPIECDDGVTILKNIELEDKFENMGVQMLRKGALRTSSEGGDGTATTTVLTQALIHEAFKEIGTDSSRVREVRERLDAGLSSTIESLGTMRKVVAEEDIEKIANISSLDAEVATVIAEIIKEVGVNGIVTVEKGAQLGYTKEVVKGARFDKGLISPFFVNDHERVQTVLEDAYIVLVDRKISSNEQIVPLLTDIGTGTNILFIATDVDSVALGTLTHNAVNGVANIACVQNPYSGNAARDFLFDMAALTGATVISEERGMKLSEAKKHLCGRADKVIVNKSHTTIIGGRPSEKTTEDRITILAHRIKSIENEIETTTSEYQRGILEDRLAALTGGIGVVRVGAYTDSEFNAKKYKFENAINATQAALQEHILPGGGVALARVDSDDIMFTRALTAPLRQMAENAGMEPHEVVNQVRAESINEKGEVENIYIGCDFKTKDFVDMFDAGIIDPFKVTRLALESAVAITKSVISMETAITVKPDAKEG